METIMLSFLIRIRYYVYRLSERSYNDIISVGFFISIHEWPIKPVNQMVRDGWLLVCDMVITQNKSFVNGMFAFHLKWKLFGFRMRRVGGRKVGWQIGAKIYICITICMYMHKCCFQIYVGFKFENMKKSKNNLMWQNF